MVHYLANKKDAFTIGINWVDKNKKTEEPKKLPGTVTPDMFDENGRIRTEIFEKPQIAAKDQSQENPSKKSVSSQFGNGNETDFNSNYDDWKKNLPEDLAELVGNTESLLKELEDIQNKKQNSLLDFIEWMKKHGKKPIESEEKPGDNDSGFKIELPKDKEAGINDPGFKIELPKNEKPNDIDPGFKLKPSAIGILPKTVPVEENKRTYQKAPDKRAKNGLNLADAYKIMDYIHNKHRVKSKDGSSYIDLRNLSPAEQNLYNQAVSAANELNPRSMVYDISGLDTSKADELIKKFEEENS